MKVNLRLYKTPPLRQGWTKKGGNNKLRWLGPVVKKISAAYDRITQQPHPLKEEIIIESKDLMHVDVAIAKVLVPLLRYYRDQVQNYQNDLEKAGHARLRGFKNAEEWQETLNRIIHALELVSEPVNLDTLVHNLDEEVERLNNRERKIEEGLALLAKYFRCL